MVMQAEDKRVQMCIKRKGKEETLLITPEFEAALNQYPFVSSKKGRALIGMTMRKRQRPVELLDATGR